MPKEARLHDYKRDAILAYARANKLDKMVCSGGPTPKIGIITTGKSYLDVRQAMEELGIDEVAANELGLRLYKVAMPYPMDVDGLKTFADDLDLIVVVEEKRSLIEVQVKEELFNSKDIPRLRDRQEGREREELAVPGQRRRSTRPTSRSKLGERIITHCHGDRVNGVKERVSALKALHGNAAAASRKPRRACRTSARAARTIRRPSCPRARAPMPASAATTWRTG